MAANPKVKGIKYGTMQQYLRQEIDKDTLYFITDKGLLYRGSQIVVPAKFIDVEKNEDAHKNTYYTFTIEAYADDPANPEILSFDVLGKAAVTTLIQSLSTAIQGLMTPNGNVIAIGTDPEASNTTSYQKDIDLSSFEGATFFELNLHATLQNLGQSAANVEVWMERGHYEKEEKEGIEEIVWYTDEHIAATQVFMAGRANAVCCANIPGHIGTDPKDKAR